MKVIISSLFTTTGECSSTNIIEININSTYSYALNGEPYKINLFVGEKPKENFVGPGSKNFVASIYSFSAPLPADGDGGCGNCKQQQKEGVRSVAQVPATFAVDKFANKDASYLKNNVWLVVVDSLGQASYLTQLDIDIITDYSIASRSRKIWLPD